MLRSASRAIVAIVLGLPLLLAASAITGEGTAQVPVRTLALDDYYALVDVSAPVLSPDGTQVAFVRETVNEEQNRRHREVWLASTTGAPAPRRLTSPLHEAGDPIWSPDGRRLAFSSDRGDGGWWFLDLEAGGEAYRVPGVEGRPVFSPDGLWIAYVKATPPTGVAATRNRRTGGAYEVVPEHEKLIAQRFRGRAIEWMGYRFDGRGYLGDPRDPAATPPRELYVVAAAGGPALQLTRLGVDVQQIAWHPSSPRLTFAADLHQRDEHTYERHDLWSADISGAVVRLTDDGWVNTRPVWTADGAALVFHRTEGLDRLLERGADRGAPEDLVWLAFDATADPATAESRMTVLTEQWDHRVGSHFVSADGREVRFATDVDGEHHLYGLPVGGGEVRAITSGRRWLTGFSVAANGDRMAYVAGTASAPGDIRVAAAADGTGEVRITTFNDALLADVVISGARPFRYPSGDGTEVEGWAILPAGYRAGAARWPLILAIHGGPHGAYGERFSFAFQLWAAAGYIVVYTNPRGSSGYGEDFLWATWGGGWGNLDGEDVMAGLDHALATWDVDPERLGVYGYSYGGFLTNWLITHTERFAAAVAGAGISNWLSDYATSDIPRTKESEFYGPPWQERSAGLLWEQSPVKHAEGARTPTLFLHGEADWRVPIEQAEQMYLALRKQGVPARMVRYPDTGHGGWKPWDEVHAAWEALEWWERWLHE